MYFNKTFFLCVLLALISLLQASVCHAKHRDLNFIYEQLLENHPGIYNELDITFKQNLDKEYSKTNKLLSETTSVDQQKIIIDTFTKSFVDPHLWVQWHSDKKPEHKNLKSAKFSYQHISPEVVWIELPSFFITQNQKQQFELIFRELPNFRKKAIIVFDLRHNQGGNSEYGSKIIDYLFGKNYADQRRNIINENVVVDWRASTDNLEHMKIQYKMHKSEWIKNVVLGMQRSLEKNQNYYRESPNLISKTIQVQNSCKVQSKIVVIIDKTNVSAVLDFIDELKMMTKSTYLIGQTTKADRLYMEVRTVKLPSGLGSFSFPIKVYRNRLRADNVPYQPDIIYEPNLINTKNIMQIIASKVIWQSE